jgi:hypothetical protein
MISNTCVAPPVGSGSAGTPSRRMKMSAPSSSANGELSYDLLEIVLD